MPQGSSLHIGLNGVDASKYNGWAGTLAGCINDANAMQRIASSQGFATSMLLDEQATAANVIAGISDAAGKLKTGDTLLISYSGHGSQVPDTTGESDSGLDSTWVCYDRMLLGHELYALWANFAYGVHIEVYSDSCHSGTVIRELVFPSGGFPPAKQSAAAPRPSPSRAYLERAAAPRAYAAVAAPARAMQPSPAVAFDTVFGPVLAARNAPTALPAAAAYPRLMPPELALQLFHQNLQMYSALQQPKAPIEAGVVLVSACQDNQVAQDGSTNGLFTEKLLSVWHGGSFSGTIPQFHRAIVALMPPTQTPNYYLVGINDDAMTQSRPLTIVNAGTVSPVAPTISGPATIDRDNGGAPTFTVNPGSNPYYEVEVATDSACFSDSSLRTAANFYGSWGDASAPKRYTDRTYTLPDAAWSALKAASMLYYRVGTTSTATGWDDYQTSTRDDAAASAPSIAIASGTGTGTTTGTGTGTTAPAAGPTISGPASLAADSDSGPTFAVTTTQPYFIVEATTDPSLFGNQAGRSDGTFYATWQDPAADARLTGTSYTLPVAAWRRLAAAGSSIAYRVGQTSSATGWNDYAVSTPDDQASSAPTIAVTPTARNGTPSLTAAGWR